MNIVLIDYDIGNVRSITNAFKKNNVEPILTNDKNTILKADGVILPGVGAFAHGMENLHKFSLVDTLRLYVDTNKPLLGICLGMQMLFEESEEFGKTKGLGFIKGRVIKMPIENKKLPHVSWNEIKSKNIKWNNTILDSVEENSDMYFVHSFVAVPKNENNILSVSEYAGFKFCSTVKKNNIYGCQYHPEKSAKNGLRVIENFIKIVKGELK
jgi:glutamine amidotransferase